MSADGQVVAFQSDAPFIASHDYDFFPHIYVKNFQSDDVDLIDVGVDGQLGNGFSFWPALSANGRYLAFESGATNLIADDNAPVSKIFLKDLQTGSMICASTDAAGNPTNGDCTLANLSADGRYLAFGSSATNLVPDDTTPDWDIYVKDLQTGAIVLASTNELGIKANADSSNATLSADGRFVAFVTTATNLAGDDTNLTYDVFVKDLQTGAVIRASTDASGTEANAESGSASLSGDGQSVAFVSSANNLVPNDTNDAADVFVKNIATGAIALASSNTSGNEGNLESERPSLSADGRYVAFSSGATNLVPEPLAGRWEVFVKDVQTGGIVMANTNAAGQAGTGSSIFPRITPDGRQVVFEGGGQNLVPQDTHFRIQIFAKNLDTGTIRVASTKRISFTGDAASWFPSLSADGQTIAFSSRAIDIVAEDTDRTEDIYAKDLQSGTFTLVSANAVGNKGNGVSQLPSISANGRYVAFESFASNLVPGDTNSTWDVFVKDVQTGGITLASADPLGNVGDGQSSNSTISGDGRYVAFTSHATNLVAGDTNNRADIFVKDLVTGVIVRASTTADGSEGDSDSGGAYLSGGGQYLVFRSSATNLVTGDGNASPDVFVKDLQTGGIVLVSADGDGNPGNEASYPTGVSADGRFVAFTSGASNLVADDTNGCADVFLKDLMTGVVVLVSTGFDGSPSLDNAYASSMSADGSRIAFFSWATNFTSRDYNQDYDAFVWSAPPTAPRNLALANAAVHENRPVGAVVGVLTPVDSEPGDSFTFELVPGLGDDDNGGFTIIGDELRTTVVLDRETRPVASVRVRVTDHNGLSFEKAFQVAIADATESPTRAGSVGGVRWTYKPSTDTLAVLGRLAADTISFETLDVSGVGRVLVLRANGSSITFDGSAGLPVIYAHSLNHPKQIEINGRTGNDAISLAQLDLSAYDQSLLVGGAGNDSLTGGPADDRLNGGAGSDNQDGGDGSDTYEVAGGNALLDTVADTGVNGVDTLINVGLMAVNLRSFGPNNGIEVVDMARFGLLGDATGNSFDFRTTTLRNLASVRGMGGNDTIYASNIAITFSGFRGYFGGDGADTLVGGSVAVKLSGDGGTDRLIGGDGADTLVGGIGLDTLTGGLGDDAFYVRGLAVPKVLDDANGNGTDDDEEGLVSSFVG